MCVQLRRQPGRRRACTSVKVTKHSTIPYVWYSFPLCNSNFVFLRYSTSKNAVTLKLGSKVTEGHWEWYHSIDCVWFPISVCHYNRFQFTCWSNALKLPWSFSQTHISLILGTSFYMHVDLCFNLLWILSFFGLNHIGLFVLSTFLFQILSHHRLSVSYAD